MRRAGRVVAVAAALVALLLAGSGCGLRVGETVDPAGGRDTATGLEGGEPTVAPSAERPSEGRPSANAEGRSPVAEDMAVPSASDEAAETTDSAQEQPQSEISEEERIHLEVETSPRCVAVGDHVSVRVQTEPRAGLMMVVAHSDGSPHGQMGFAEANPEGIYVWRWVVGPQVPPGKAAVLVGAWSEDGERGGNENDEFEVAGLEGCP